MLFTRHSNRIRNTRGFTLVEMLVIAPIVILAISGFVGTLIYMTGDAISSRADNTMAYEIQDALARIEQDVRLSGAFLPTSNINIVAPQGYDNATGAFESASSTTGTMLVLNTFATTKNPTDATREPSYLADTPNACSSANIAQNQLLTMNVVYFIKNNSLWRRTIVSENYMNKDCPSKEIWQQPSCTPNSYTAPTICQTNDIEVLKNIAPNGLSLQYYPSAQSTTPTAAASSETISVRSAALPNMNTVGVTLTAAQTVAGRDLVKTGTLRATRIGAYNDFATPAP